jgi:hypothetical protein
MKIDRKQIKSGNDKYVPYWKAAIIFFGGTGLLTCWIDLGYFWKGYVLDMVGPAWIYILIRGLFTYKADNLWTRFFSPKKTFYIFIIICVGLEIAQYLKLYEATYDPWDFLAYISFLLPVFIIDLYLSGNETSEKLESSKTR